MCAHSRVARAALWFAAAGWLSLSGCSPIDADRESFVSPQAIATRTAAQAQLSLVHHQARHDLNVKVGAPSRPAASRGTFHEAYQRWLRGEVRELPSSGEGASKAGN